MNIVKLSAYLSGLVFSIGIIAAVSPAHSAQEAALNIQLKFHQIILFISSDTTEYKIARMRADLYQTLQPQTPAQKQRQLEAQLAAASLANLATDHAHYLQQATLLEQQTDPEFAGSGPLLLTRAKVHIERQQPQLAAPLLEKAITTFDDTTEHQLFLGQSLDLLCHLQLEQGARQEEANVCERFYHWTQQSELANNEQRSNASHNLAMLRLWSSQPEQAKELFTQAIALRQLEGNSATALVNSLQGYAHACDNLSLFAQSETALLQAVHILTSEPGNTLTQRMQLLHNIAENQALQGKYAQAFQTSEKALQLLQTNQQQDAIQLGALQNQLGSLAQDLARFETALAYYQLALQSFRSRYKNAHPYTAAVLNNLGSVYGALKNLEKSKEYYQEALTMRQQVYGPAHVEVIVTENNLALVYEGLGQIDAATTLLEQSLAKMQKSADAHPNMSVIAVNLGRIYTDNGDSRAEFLLKNALQEQQKRLGAQHPDLLPTLHGLARYYRNQQLYMDAEQLYLRSLRIAETSFPTFHPDIADCLFQLGSLYQQSGEYTKAELFYRKELAILHNNNNDAGRQSTLKRLVQVLEAAGKLSEAQQFAAQLDTSV